MTRQLQMSIAALLAIELAWSAQVLAAAADSEARAGATLQGGVLDEVVVTARKRSEDAKDVPIALTAFGAEQLANMGAATLKDLHSAIPSLSYSDRGALQTQITIRGVGGDSRSIGLESGVALYIDGVFAGRTSGYNVDLADVASVEVLRGPQGTLFGKNTTGGAVLITTTKPDYISTADAGVSYGNYDAMRVKGSVSGALGENVFAKAAVSTWDRDGYLSNLFDAGKLQNEERRSARVQLRYLPSDALEINFSADATRDRNDSVLNQLGSNAAFGAGYYDPDRLIVNTDQRNSIARDILGGSVTVDYKFDSGFTFTSISAARKVDVEVYSDLDQTPLNVLSSGPFTDNSTHYTQELRLASPSDGTFSYVLGLYYFRQNADALRRIYQGAVPLFFTDGPVDTESTAGFANADYKLTDRLTLTGGLRLTSEQKSGYYTQTSSVAAAFNKTFPSLELDETAVSWTSALRYRLTDDVSSYLSVSRGFKSGGFNVDPLATPAPLTAADLTFKQELVTSYELGVKADLFDGVARISTALFFAEYDDRQVPQFETVGGIPTVITRNAGQAEIKGIELELSAFVTDYLLLSTGVSVLDGEYTDFRGASAGGADYTGNKTENTPEYSVSLGAQLKVPTATGEWQVAPQLSYAGKTYLQPDNLPFNQENGYFLASLRAGYNWDSGRYGVFVWGKNLTNEQYKEFARQFSGSDQVLWGEPRTYGIEFLAHY